MRTQRKQPRRQYGTKVTAPKHLKFRSSLFKGLQGRGTASPSLPQERNTPEHPNRASKIKRSKAKLTNKKRNAAKRCKTKRSNVSYYLNKTANLHCAYSILSQQNHAFSKFASAAEQIWKTKQNYKRVKFRNETKPADT